MITSDIVLCISILLFIFGVSLTIYYIKQKKGGAKRSIIGLICSTASALFPLYLMDSSSSPGGVLDNIFRALLGVARSMMGENSLQDTRAAFLGTTGELTVLSAVYTSFLHVVATLLLLGLLFSFFENFFPKIKYHFFSKGSLTIFSDVSDRTLILARDMRNEEKKGNKSSSLFVFLGDSAQINMTNARHMKELKELNAFLFKESICDIHPPTFFRSRKIDFFLLQHDETTNMKDAIELSDKWSEPIHRFKNQELDIRIHILSNKPEAEYIVDSIEYDSKLKLRLIREARTALYHLVDTKPLFLGIRNEQLTILIIGAGNNGFEAIKTVAWCGHTLHITPKILVIDSNETVSQQFTKECPELADSPDQAIEFVTLDVTTASYTDFLRAHPEIGYVICTLEDESLNINTAMHTRGIFDEIRFLPENTNYTEEPLIHVLITHPFLHDVVSRMQFDCRQNCHLHAFGSLEATYTWENITGSYLDCIGIAINRFYELEYAKSTLNGLPSTERSAKIEACILQADENYEKKEYNRCSSIALGLHSKYKIYSILIEMEKNSLDTYHWQEHPSSEMINKVETLLSNPSTAQELIEQLSILEHRRWNAYMRTQGWRTVTTEQMDLWYHKLGTKHRNFAAKLTPCLVSWEALPLVDKEIFDSHPDNKTDFQLLDKIFVENLAHILLDAQKIYDLTFIK